MRSDLLAQTETTSTDRWALQNAHLLKVTLGGDAIVARQGAMVAYQGSVEFDYQSGGIGKMLKKAVTGEGFPIMRAAGTGELFLARDAWRVHLLHLEGDSVTVNGDNVLAFDAALEWDVKRVQGVGAMLASGAFNTVLSGTGTVAIVTDGQPVVLDAGAQPTFADIQAAVAWSGGLQTRVSSSFKLASLVGRGSGEAFQLAFTGQGFVVVQPSEGGRYAAQQQGDGGGGGGLLGKVLGG